MKPEKISARGNIRYIGFLCIFVLIIAAPSLLYPFGRDQGEYAVIARASLDGKVIYRDVFNVKPPLTHAVHQIALVLGGNQMLSIRLLDLFWQLSTTIMLFILANKIFNRPIIGLISGCLYVASYYLMGFWDTAQTDGFTILPIAVGVYLFYEILKKWRIQTGIACGAAIGVAALFKYPIGILVVFFVLLFIVSKGRQNVTKVFWLALGFCIPFIILVFSLWVRGNLWDFFQIQGTYIPTYSGQRPDQFGYFLISFSSIIFFFVREIVFLDLFPTIGLVGFISIISFFTLLRDGKRKEIVPIGLWWLSAVIHLGIQNKYYAYHSLPLIAPQSLIVAGLISMDPIKGWRKFSRFLPYLLLGWFLAAHIGNGFFDNHSRMVQVLIGESSLDDEYSSKVYDDPGGDYSPRADINVARYIANHSHADDLVFIWGFEPTIYFLAEREFATQYLFNYPLYGTYATSEIKSNFLAKLKTDTPIYFIVAQNDSIPHVTGVDDDSLSAFMEYTELYEFVTSSYQLETIIEDFQLYRRK